MIKNKVSLSLASLLFISCTPALAGKKSSLTFDGPLRPQEVHSKSSCGQALEKGPGPIEVISSGRDSAFIGELTEAAEIVTDIAYRLGLSTPPHQINMVPAHQLTMLATAGAHPAPHWLDGARVIGGMAGAGGVLEFVTPGCPTCRSFYSDTTGFFEQVSVLMHVAGHNDVALNSIFAKARPMDPMAESYELAEMVRKLYLSEDKDEVAQFYQWLNSMGSLQDYATGTFDSPESLSPLAPKAQNSKVDHSVEYDDIFGFTIEDPNKNPYDRKDNPTWTTTSSVLQSMVNQLPDSAPQWKKDLLRQFEKAKRFTPFVVQTKILNEGWATLMELLIAKHSPWVGTRHSFDFGQLLQGVAVPGLDNPYWLGLTGWINLYEQFQARPDIQAIEDAFERDKLFVAYAKNTYQDISDYDWLRVAIDRRWTEKFNLFLFRQTRQEEMDPNVEPEKQKYIALSRDPQRILRKILRSQANRRLQIPRLIVKNPQYTKTGSIDLVHDVIENLPLDRFNTSQALYVLTQVMEKTVTLETVGSLLWNPEQAQALFQTEPVRYGQAQRPKPTKVPSREEMTYRLKYEIPPNGEAIVWRLAPVQKPQAEESKEATDTNEEESTSDVASDEEVEFQWVVDQEHTALTRQAIAYFIHDSAAGYNDELQEYNRSKWQRFSSEVQDAKLESSMPMVDQAPTVAGALSEYASYVAERMWKALKEAANGQRPIKQGKNGVKLKVLPNVPDFGFDQQIKKQYLAIQNETKPSPVDPSPTQMDQDLEWDADDVSNIMSGHYMPGERFPGPQNQQGQGEGEGEEGEGEEGEGQGEPQPGDPQEGEGDDPVPAAGDGKSDPTEVEIPLKLWGEYLAQQLELPNIRRTEGKNTEVQPYKRGSVKKPAGEKVWEKIALEAIKKAIVIRKKNKKPFRIGQGVTAAQLIKEGMRYIDSGDFHVKSYEDEPLPDFDAVLVISIDMTGSMSGKPLEIAKNLAFNIKALLAAKYKNVKIHYIGFNEEAKEFPESKIWKVDMGGGTKYAPPLELTQEILAEYPDSKWNKYALVIGDGQGYDGDDFVDKLRELSESLQYFGMAVTGPWEPNQSFVKQVSDFHQEWPWVGTTRLKEQEDIPQGLIDLFRPDGEEIDEE